MQAHIEGFIDAAGWWSYVIVFAATAGETSVFVGLLLPGEMVILFASALAGRGDLDVTLLSAVVVTGGVTGDSLGYALGRHRALRPRGRRWRRTGHDRHRGKAQAFLRRHGGAAVFTGRFIGFVRTFLPYLAGRSGMPYRRFLLHSAAASLVWGLGNVLLGYFAGTAAAGFLHSAGAIGIAVLVAAAVATHGITRILPRHRTALVPSKVVAHGGAARKTAPTGHALTHARE
jgi:membrane protein DedA with SNARE-associated domain